jgi:hypothetical protein
MTDEQRFEDIIAKRKRFNKQPFSHWERMADELVVESLVRASLCDRRSIVGYMAAKRLMSMALNESPTLVKKVLEERAICQQNMMAIFDEFRGDEPFPTVQTVAAKLEELRRG